MSFSSRGFSVVDRVLYILAPIEDQLCLVGLEVQLLQHVVPYGKPIFRTDSNGIGLSAQTTDSFLQCLEYADPGKILLLDSA